ncbi:hypothetical protein DSO57_1006328 [Entomophthora muscae]|uniref:Uncharacterized protein n=1 Tax=Entomophthora muscae TaxID=34485 RepID=A0ACC2U712_9FUNG|nr:hypothetical protein DSO57_1006328 [Entomophthora muscae]
MTFPFILAVRNVNFIYGPGSTPEQNPLRPASSEDCELISPQPVDNLPVSKVDANPPGSEYLTAPQSFASKLPVPDAGSFPEVPKLDTSGLLGEINKSTNESCPKLA